MKPYSLQCDMIAWSFNVSFAITAAKVRRMNNPKQLLRRHCTKFGAMWTLKKCQLFLYAILLLFVSFTTRAQTKVLRGVIQDEQSGDPVPFASIKMKKSGLRMLSDSS